MYEPGRPSVASVQSSFDHEFDRGEMFLFPWSKYDRIDEDERCE